MRQLEMRMSSSDSSVASWGINFCTTCRAARSLGYLLTGGVPVAESERPLCGSAATAQRLQSAVRSFEKCSKIE